MKSKAGTFENAIRNVGGKEEMTTGCASESEKKERGTTLRTNTEIDGARWGGGGFPPRGGLKPVRKIKRKKKEGIDETKKTDQDSLTSGPRLGR